MVIYMNDVIVTGINIALINQLPYVLGSKFVQNDLDDLHYILGIEVILNTYGLFLTQSRDAIDLLERVFRKNVNPFLHPSLPFIISRSWLVFHHHPQLLLT